MTDAYSLYDVVAKLFHRTKPLYDFALGAVYHSKGNIVDAKGHVGLAVDVIGYGEILSAYAFHNLGVVLFALGCYEYYIHLVQQRAVYLLHCLDAGYAVGVYEYQAYHISLHILEFRAILRYHIHIGHSLPETQTLSIGREGRKQNGGEYGEKVSHMRLYYVG